MTKRMLTAREWVMGEQEIEEAGGERVPQFHHHLVVEAIGAAGR